jgi:hypothetical protein
LPINTGIHGESAQCAGIPLPDKDNNTVNRAFWRGVILTGLLVLGVGLLRMVPQRIAAGSAGKPDKLS